MPAFVTANIVIFLILLIIVVQPLGENDISNVKYSNNRLETIPEICKMHQSFSMKRSRKGFYQYSKMYCRNAMFHLKINSTKAFREKPCISIYTEKEVIFMQFSTNLTMR